MARVSLKPIIRFVIKHQHKCTTTTNLRFKRHYSVTLPDTTTTTTNNQIPSTRSYSSQQEIDQLGSWNTRINFDISEEQSIRRGTPIPILNSSQVGTYSDQGRRMYQVSIVLISRTEFNAILENLFTIFNQLAITLVFDIQSTNSMVQNCKQNFIFCLLSYSYLKGPLCIGHNGSRV